jgi:amino acid transporter
VRPANWFVADWSAVRWLPFLNIMFWNLNYWDTVSTLAGEVRDASRTFPRALFSALGLVVAAYLLPLLVGLGVAPGHGGDDWTLGYFAAVARRVGGAWLAWWVVAAAAVSQLGQFEAEMSTDSYQLQGMAERGFLPAVFARRSRYGTPTAAIAASALGVAAMAWFDFLEIVQLLNVVYCLAEVLEFAAFLRLRATRPDLRRPFRVPLSTAGCVAMLTPAFLLLAFMLLAPIALGEWRVVGFTTAAVAGGAALYPALALLRRRGWVEFVAATPEDFHEALLRGEQGGEDEAAGGDEGVELLRPPS